MLQQIVPENTPCNCKDCGKPMEVAQQALMRGFVTIVTCWTPGCLLATVTLSTEQYKSLSEIQFEAYREMNRTRAMGKHVLSSLEGQY